jgi:hypothetical protein
MAHAQTEGAVMSDEMEVRAQLRAQLGSVTRKISGTAKGRKALEKRAMAPDDGRLKRVRGETKQLNVEIDADLKTWLARASRDHRLTYVELVERGLELVKADLERSNA